MNPFDILQIDQQDVTWQDLATCARSEYIDPRFFDKFYLSNPAFRPTVDGICLNCPVLKECLMAGVGNKETGVWGGTYLEDGKPVSELNEHKTDEFKKRLTERIYE